MRTHSTHQRSGRRMAADEDGPGRDSFFAKEENPFKEIDEQRQAPIVEGGDELETNVDKL